MVHVPGAGHAPTPTCVLPGLHRRVYGRVGTAAGHSQHGTEKRKRGLKRQKERQGEIFYVWKGFIPSRASIASVTLRASGTSCGKTRVKLRKVAKLRKSMKSARIHKSKTSFTRNSCSTRLPKTRQGNDKKRQKA